MVAKSGISGKTRLAGVIGWPVSHSLSPRLHNYWLNRLNIDGAYVPLPVEPSNLEHVLRALPHMGFAGANVTVPHKENVFRIVDETDQLSWQVGAVNTVDVLPDGRLRGRNTDVFGFAENIRIHAPAFQPSAGPALVLGAGGAARGVLVALAKMGVPEIWITNRTRSKADALATMMRDLVDTTIHVVSWDLRAKSLKDAHLLVNTTSLGMVGQNSLDIDLTDLHPDTLVTDIVYAPLETDLLARAKDFGNPVVDGLGMLLYQAQPAFEHWFGHVPPVDLLTREFVLSEQAQASQDAASQPTPAVEILEPVSKTSEMPTKKPLDPMGDVDDTTHALLDDWLGED